MGFASSLVRRPGQYAVEFADPDAANRLFLVLIDKKSMEESWKMKRNIELLGDEVNSYLDEFNAIPIRIVIHSS